MTRIVVDTSNIIFRIAAMNIKHANGSEEENVALALHAALTTIRKYYNKYKPTQIFFTFDGRNNWRKEYTASDAAFTPMPYKGNRVVDKTKEHFFKIIDEFRSLVDEHTSIICLRNERLEADDFISGVVQQFASPTSPVIIISADKDFVQLLKYPGVRLIDPATDKDRVCEDVDYFIFEKCIRGDAGDNVMSSYPRVRATKLKEAMTDSYALTQIMKHEWTHPNGETYKVEELFNENKLLMILDQQPDDIKELIKKSINEAIENNPRYNHFQFIKFLGKHKMQNILENVNVFAEMFMLKHDESKPQILIEEKVEDSLLSY
jgi:hypothetical protein